MEAVLQKVWVFLKSYWYVPLIAVLIVVVGVVSRETAKDLWVAVKEAHDSYKRERAQLNDLDKQKREKKEKVEQQYSAVVKTLEEKAKVDVKKLDEGKQKEIKEMSEKSEEELAKYLQKEFGLVYVKRVDK